MRAQEFVLLSHGLCALLGGDVPPPELGPGGIWLQRLPVPDIKVYLLYAPDADLDTASLVIELGPINRACEPQAWTDMLESNYALHAGFAPRFGRHPNTGEGLMQAAFHLAETTAADFYPRLQEMLASAREQRRHYGGTAP
jgi:hypothetical protein